MYIFALFPLCIYFFCLFVLNRRRNPAVLNGSQDFLLLAFGLFGFITLGPGKWLVPLELMTFWGFTIWFFWTAFYFAAAHTVSQRLTNRIIIYHCPRQWFIANFLEHVRTLDAGAQLNGNVLFLPGLGIQCAASGDRFGGHTLLLPTEPKLDDQQQKQWKTLNETVITFCRTQESPKSKVSLLWGLLTAATGGLMAVTLIRNGTVLLKTVADLWG